MKPPKRLGMTYDGIRDGKIYYNIRPSRFYLFKTILKIAWEARPWLLSIVVALYGCYYYLSSWKERQPIE